MKLCKYCGEPLLEGQTDYCDIVCKNMDRLVAGELKLPRRTARQPDKFSVFVAAQREAKRRGKRLSYGDWQSRKYPNKINKIGKE